MNTFPERLKHAVELRERELGERILKKEIAAAANVSPSAVTWWYQGKTHDLKADSILRVAKFLRVRVEWLKDKKGPMKESGQPSVHAAAETSDEMSLLAARAERLVASHGTTPRAYEDEPELSKEARTLINKIKIVDQEKTVTKDVLQAFNVIFDEMLPITSKRKGRGTGSL